MTFAALQRAEALLGKGPEHWANLGRFYLSQVAQRALGAWRADRLTDAAFVRQLNLRGTPADIAQHFRTRPTPRFFFSEEDLPQVVARVSDDTRAQTVARADELLQHTFRFRSQPPVTFNGSINWQHTPQGNTDWRWELNRHAYFVTLGRAFAYTRAPKYVAEFQRLMLDWLTHNPPAVNAPNWASPLEAAFRLNVWVWAYYHFRAALEDEAVLALVRGLWWHLRFLAANLEYSSPNNHLWLEAKALAFGSLLFPEIRAARGWRNLGLRVLWREVRRQVRLDGVHAEQAPLYHRILTSELLELLLLAKHHHLKVPPVVLERFEKMCVFEHAARKPNGEIPLWGDSALEDSYARYDPLSRANPWWPGPATPPTEADVWLGQPGVDPLSQRERAGVRESLGSQAFREGGYFFLRAPSREGEAYVGFDSGPFGYKLAPGHGHADALSFEFFARGRNLIVDPGVYSYHLGAEWRRFFRSTAAHNTLAVDEQDQTVLLDDWRVLRPAKTRLHQWLTHPMLDLVEGSHTGYTRLPQPITHRRQLIFIKPDYLIVVDRLTGKGQHCFDLHFHLMPDAQPRLEGSGLVRVQHHDEVSLLIASLTPPATQVSVLDGQTEPIQGWVSRYSGEKQAAPVVRYRARAAAPAEFITLLWPHAASSHATVRVEPLPLGTDTFALSITTHLWRDVILIQNGRPREHNIDGCTTNAPIAYWRLLADSEVWRVALPQGGEWRGAGVHLRPGTPSWEKGAL